MKRLKKILLWTALSVGIALVAFLFFFAYFTWSASRELERRLTELRAEGEPLSIADLAHEPIPPETNAAVFLQRADDDVEAARKELTALYPQSFVPPLELTEAEIENLDDLFAAYPNLMPLLERAAACPDYNSEPDAPQSPTAFLQPLYDRGSKFRDVIRVLRARSRLLTAQGRLDDALANQILMLRLCGAWSREPFLPSYLVRLGCRTVAVEGANEVLRVGPVTPASREALDAELALLDTSDDLIWALRSERAFSLSVIRDSFEKAVFVPSLMSNSVALRFLDFYDQLLEHASRPPWQSRFTPRFQGGWNPLDIMITQHIPAMQSTREAAERVRAISRSLRVLNALQAHGVEEVPANLNGLGLPEKATIDPFNGEPLRVKKLPDGWLVYSVGKNRRDDDGMWAGRRLFGLGPIEEDEEAKQP